MPITLQTSLLPNGAGVVSIRGSFLDEESAKQVSEAVARFTSVDHPKLIIDLEGVTFLSSRAIGELVRAHISTIHRNGRLVICGLNERVYTVLTVTKLNMVLNLVRSLDEAKKTFA
jgi:anti-sigma B factor antagonist